MKRLIPLAAIFLAACHSVPPTNVHQPMTIRPEPRNVAPVANGAIFQAVASRPLFEDRRARFVGDTITVKITENTSASKKASNKLDRTGSQTASISAFAGLPVSGLSGLDISGRSANNFSGKGEAANNAVFSGNLTVTVIDVLPNGNLLVSGEKQIAIGDEQEYIRISGVVNPAFVDFSNTVDSAKIADARIEYKSSGQIADGQVMGWLARFFLSVLPF
ncbi:flagellar L-ring protein precursor FlgH [Azonexus fungiphilus]|jgi:flagellar L-ring protein precursor FlgH|uniref:Flagellar L-ring protein n=1 Tax=Azonexus fungiphilus TaxID=146940 RepID=A0A495VPP6_9RHOO|nr:flagellar basal body L-ring protein FlgH [Azonexus fungiphilus]NHC07226.1 flagellar basal body L-ring protein FlgH [Azonexus fungiphilus]RKT50403.1 flagellar L-ring protein precursor FlgH [Azonexus fungiphilus]